MEIATEDSTKPVFSAAVQNEQNSRRFVSADRSLSDKIKTLYVGLYINMEQ
jgi:hypothetical protein